MQAQNQQENRSGSCQTIGNLMTGIEKNAQNSVSIATSSSAIPTGSETTTMPEETQCSTGMQLSSHGLEMLRNSVKMGDPTAIETSLLESLKSDFGSRLDIVETTNEHYERTGYRLTIHSEIPQNWLAAINHLNQAGAGENIAYEISRLRTLTAKRKEKEFDLELSIDAMTEELKIYPLDIVRYVCREWARKNTFFPVLKEMIDGCEKHMHLRRALLGATKTKATALPSPKRSVPAYEGRKSYGDTPKDQWDKAHYDEAINEAVRMVNMAAHNPSWINGEEWQKRIDTLTSESNSRFKQEA